MQDGLRCSRATSLSIASNCRRLIDECEEITGLYELAAALLRRRGNESRARRRRPWAGQLPPPSAAR